MLELYSNNRFCKKNGAFDPNNGKCSKRRFDGSKAEEYGSHDKTFQMTEAVWFALWIQRNCFMEQAVEAKTF
jgi:monomeric isocitrate dehydrogenase